jgi:hypothetical protein
MSGLYRDILGNVPIGYRRPFGQHLQGIEDHLRKAQRALENVLAKLKE